MNNLNNINDINSQNNKNKQHLQLKNKLQSKIQEKKLKRMNHVVRNNILEETKKNMNEYMQMKREKDIEKQKEIRDKYLENMKTLEKNVANNISPDNFDELTNIYNDDNLPDISND